MEQTITINKINATRAIQASSGETKKVLGILFGNAVNRDPMEFSGYDELCEAEEIDPIRSLPYPEPRSIKEAFINGAYKLATIFEAFNNRCGENFDQTWEADYTDDDQRKHYPWGEYSPSLSAFVFSYSNYSFTDSDLGARLCTDTEQKAKHIATKYAKEWNEFINPKL